MNGPAGPAATAVIRERVVRLGPGGVLTGVLAEPAGLPDGGAARRALVMANVGLMHHVGPFRLYVELSRLAARLGWRALRFDLSGFGDSAPRPGAGSDQSRAEADLGAALDWLERTHGVREAVLVGLCSGVDSTHPVAARDARVAGAVFVDGYAYATPGALLRRYALRPLQAGRWQRLARRRLRELRGVPDGAAEGAAGAAAVPTPDGPVAVYERTYPTRAEFRGDVRRMTARGARLLFVYTGAYDGVFNGPGQMGEILGRGAPAAVEAAWFPAADHLLSGVAHRRAFFDRVERWLRAFPPGTPGPPEAAGG